MELFRGEGWVGYVPLTLLSYYLLWQFWWLNKTAPLTVDSPSSSGVSRHLLLSLLHLQRRLSEDASVLVETFYANVEEQDDLLMMLIRFKPCFHPWVCVDIIWHDRRIQSSSGPNLKDRQCYLSSKAPGYGYGKQIPKSAVAVTRWYSGKRWKESSLGRWPLTTSLSFW